MKIRLLQKKDIPAAAAIVRRNYSAKFAQSAKKELEEMFGKARIKPLYFVAEDKGVIVGFSGCMASWMDYGVQTMFWVNVLPDRQREGIGKKLVTKTLNALKKRKPDMILITTTLPEFYEKYFGFKVLAPLPNGYSLMGLSLRQ